MRTIIFIPLILLTLCMQNVSSQNVGIGTSVPKAKLDIASDLILKSGDLILSDGNTSAAKETIGVLAVSNGDGDGEYTYPSIHGDLYAKGNACPAGYFHGLVIINQNLNVYQDVVCRALFENSDINLKRIITPITSFLQNILKTKPVNYYWNNDLDYKKIKADVIAQELPKIYPELVSTDKEDKHAIDFIGQIPYLIRAVQERQLAIEKLKKENLRLIQLQREVEEFRKLIIKSK